MDFELEQMIEDGASVEEIFEYVSIYRQDLWMGKYFDIDGRRLYINRDKDGEIIGFDWD